MVAWKHAFQIHVTIPEFAILMMELRTDAHALKVKNEFLKNYISFRGFISDVNC